MKSMVKKIQVLSLALLLSGVSSYATDTLGDALATATEASNTLATALPVVAAGITQDQTVAKTALEITVEKARDISQQADGLSSDAKKALEGIYIAPSFCARTIAAAKALPGQVKAKASCAFATTCGEAKKAGLWIADNKGKTILIVGGVAVVAYIAWTWYQAEKEKEADFARCR